MYINICAALRLSDLKPKKKSMENHLSYRLWSRALEVLGWDFT